MEPRIQFAQAQDGTNIAFFSLGEGIPYISMPPIPWTHLQLEWDDPDFRRWLERTSRGKQMVRYDNRGSGLSDRQVTDISLEAHLSDVDAVADKLGLERFALVGISSSSPAAIAYAASRPERVSHLVLWCGYARSEDTRTPQTKALRDLRSSDWTLFTETIAHAMIAGWSAGEQARRFAELMRQSVEPAFSVVWRSSDVSDELPNIRCPTLVMHRRDVIFPQMHVAQRLAAAIPNAQLALLEGDSILPYIGDMEAAARAIDAFLGVSAEASDATPAAVERASPGGTLATILFTDVEGSTALTQRMGDAKAREVMRQHEQITRQALTAHGGSEVKTMGDGFMASFDSASRALECAVAIQRAFADHNERADAPILVRVGLNAGEPIAEERDLFGTAVIMASRIAAKAQGGEIFVSNVVRELVAGKDFLFADRGEMVMRGFEDPVRVYEVRWKE